MTYLYKLELNEEINFLLYFDFVVVALGFGLVLGETL